jgi:hypothetical protein
MASGRKCPNLAAMNGNAIRISVELRMSGDCLTGRVSDGTGLDRPFSGWLGLLAAIDSLLPGQAADSNQEEQQ